MWSVIVAETMAAHVLLQYDAEMDRPFIPVHTPFLKPCQAEEGSSFLLPNTQTHTNMRLSAFRPLKPIIIV